MKTISRSFSFIRTQHAAFSTKTVSKYSTSHLSTPIHPKFYENDFESTLIDELEFVRSPFYDIAKLHHTKEGEEAQKLLHAISEKMNMIDLTQNLLKPAQPNKENVAFKRFADRVADEKFHAQLQFPRGKAYERIDPVDLFRVAKTDSHWTDVRRSKSFIADDFFPPIELHEHNLKAIFDKLATNQVTEAQACSDLKQVIPRLNHD